MKSYRLAALAWVMAAGLMPVAWAAEDPGMQLGFSRTVAAAMQGIDPERIRAHWIQSVVARRLFTASGLNLDEMIALAGTRNFQARELPVRFKAHIESRVRQFKSYNVVGLAPGTQAGAAAQAVVFTAHYDHLGIDPAMSGHNIYNGAVDNATEVTAGRMPPAPPR